MSIDFKFNLGEKVIVSEIQRPAHVTAMRITHFGKEVLVCFWNDSKREEVWVYESELEPRK